MDHYSKQRPGLPAKTPTPQVLGKHNVYSATLPSTLHEKNETMETKINYGSISKQRMLQERVINKMIAKLPSNVKENVSAIINMTLSISENAQKDLEISHKEVAALRNELGKKHSDYLALQKNYEVYKERLRLQEDTVQSLKDNLDYTQKHTIKNRSAMSRLAQTNRMLIDSLDALEYVPGSKNAAATTGTGAGKQASPPVSPSLKVDSLDPPKLDESGRGKGPRTLAPINSTVAKSKDSKNKEKDNDKPKEWGITNLEAEAKYSAFQNDKLRESLLRVAREHYRSMKNSEILEEKVTELRTKLRVSENYNRKLKSELDEIRSLQDSEAQYSDNFMQPDASKIRTPTRKTFGYVDERLVTLLERDGFDPIDGIVQLRRVLAHAAASPSNLNLIDVIAHVVSRDAMRIFDASMICLFLLKPGNSEYMEKYTVRSTKPTLHGTSEVASVALDTIQTGKTERLNVLSHHPEFNAEIDGSAGVVTKRLISMPLYNRESNRIIGAIEIINKGQNNEVFSEIDELLGMVYADQASQVITGCLQYNKLTYRAEILQNLLESSTALFEAIPEPNSLALAKNMSPGQILKTLEDIARQTLRCADAKAFLISDYIGMEPGDLVMLERVNMSSMSHHEALNAIKTVAIGSGLAGFVVNSRDLYVMEDAGLDPYMNPLIDLSIDVEAMVVVPIVDLYGTVVGCVELIIGPNSPKLRPNDDSRDNKILFTQAAQWLAHQFATPLQYLINSIGRPVDRPVSAPKTVSLGLHPKVGHQTGSFYEMESVESKKLSKLIHASNTNTAINAELTSEKTNRSKSGDDHSKADFTSVTFTNIKFDTTRSGASSRPTTTEKAVSFMTESEPLLVPIDDAKQSVIMMGVDVSEHESVKHQLSVSEKALEESNSTASALLHDKVELQQLNSQLESDKEALHAQLQEQQEQQKQLHADIAALHAQVESANTNTDVNSEVERLKEESSKLKKTIASEKKQIEKLQDQITQFDAEKATFLDNTEKSRTALIKSVDEKNVLSTENDRLRREIEKLHEQLRAAQQTTVVAKVEVPTQTSSQETLEPTPTVAAKIEPRPTPEPVPQPTSEVITLVKTTPTSQPTPAVAPEIVEEKVVKPTTVPVALDIDDNAFVRQPSSRAVTPTTARRANALELVTINKIRASGLINMQLVGKQHSYIRIKLGDKVLKTPTSHDGGNDALFDDLDMEFDVLPVMVNTNALLEFTVYSKNAILNDEVIGYGTCRLPYLRREDDHFNTRKGLIISIDLRLNDRTSARVTAHLEINAVFQYPPIDNENPGFSGDLSTDYRDLGALPPLEEASVTSSYRESTVAQEECFNNDGLYNINNDMENGVGNAAENEAVVAGGIKLGDDIDTWQEQTDSMGRTYYYNPLTDESVWENPYGSVEADADANYDTPSEPLRRGNWVQNNDENGNSYWVNELTGESLWELPEDADADSGGVDHSSGVMNDGLYQSSQDSYSATAGDYTIEL